MPGKGSIVRQWRCFCPARHREGFLEHLQRTGVDEAAALPGYQGHAVLERPMAVRGRDGVEITLLTFWEHFEDIRAFAGDDPDTARLYPGDEAYEIEPETRVLHHAVASLAL